MATSRRAALMLLATATCTLLCVLGLLSPVAASVEPATVAVIPIEGEINDIKVGSVKRRVEEALAKSATTIIFEFDTPGGLVTSALDLSKYIKGLSDRVRTVSFVRQNAYSAGAMIALASDELWMSRASSIGDCAPIMIDPSGQAADIEGSTLQAKVESPILQEFRDSAIRNGYDPLLCRAMVAMEVEVWWIESLDGATRKFVETAEKKSLIDDTPDSDRVWRLVTAALDPLSGQMAPIDQPIDRADQLLTLSQSDAVIFGIARGVKASVTELTAALKLGAPARLEISGWELFVEFLNSPIVRAFLLIVAMTGAYLEVNKPGLIVPGVAAGIAMLIFFAAPYMAGFASIWVAVFMIIGILLLGLEIFVIPGFGIAGLLGIALIFIAIIGTFVPAEPDSSGPIYWPTLSGTWQGIETGLTVLFTSVVSSFVAVLLILRYLPKMPASQLIPANPTLAQLALEDPFENICAVGDVGIVTGDLKPAGFARFGQEIVDVQSQGEFVERGRRVQVIRHEGRTIVVAPMDG